MTPAVTGASRPGLRAAAIIIAALGEDLAKEVVAHLPTSQVLALGDELAALQEVPTAELNQVLAEFVGRLRAQASVGGPAFARSVLAGTLGLAGGGGRHGDDAAGTILGRVDEVDAGTLFRIIAHERRQTIAAVLTHLSPPNAADLLGHWDETTVADIAYRAAHLGTLSPGTMEALGEALELEVRASRTRAADTREVSLDFVVDLINSMTPARSKQVLEALQGLDASFGDGVAEQVFTFDDVLAMGERNLQIVLRAVDMSVLVLALKGIPEELRERARQNLSQRGQERFDEEASLLGAVPLTQVHEAQRQVTHAARELADAGEISLRGGGEEYVE